MPKIGAFVFLPIYLKHLSPSDYGIVSSLHVLNSVLTVLFTLSLPRALYRVYYDYKTELEKKTLFGTVFISVVVISLFSLALLFLFKNQVQKIYESINFYPYFAYAILIVFIQSLHVIPTVFLQIKERAAVYIGLSIPLFFFKSTLILWFIVYLQKGVIGYLQAELLAAIVFLPIYYLFIYKNLSLRWDFNVFRSVLKFSLPIIPSILSAWILNLSDRIFIERYFSTQEVGIYSLGYQIAGLVLIFSIAFKKAYDPYFYKIANSTDKLSAKQKLFKTNYVFIVILVLASFMIAFFAKEGITLFFDDRYYSAFKIIPIISLAYLISQNSALLNIMLYQEKKTKVVMFITLGSAILNIGLNFILIPLMGIYGAAWATVLSFLSVFILSYFIAQKAFFIPYNWLKIVPLIAFLTALFFIFYHLKINNIYLLLFLKTLTIVLIGSVLFIRNKAIIYSFIKVKK